MALGSIFPHKFNTIVVEGLFVTNKAKPYSNIIPSTSTSTSGGMGNNNIAESGDNTKESTEYKKRIKNTNAVIAATLGPLRLLVLEETKSLIL